MKTKKDTSRSGQDRSRRGFIEQGSLLVASAAVVSFSGITVSCKDHNSVGQEETEKEEEKEEMVSPTEDLMREHGLLQRMLLIYDAAIALSDKNEEFDPAYLNRTATIIRDFVEDYHEKLEEDYLFPRLEKANRLTDLTFTLRRQHIGGRTVTDRILALTKNGGFPKGKNLEEVVVLLQAFNSMYRPHEAREDTVLFPVFKEVVSTHEYDALGEDFERIEQEKFGDDGFFVMVDKVAEIEKQIGIYELDQFTPNIKNLPVGNKARS